MDIQTLTKFSDIISPINKINEVIIDHNDLNTEVENLDFSVFTGATDSEAGIKGMVPAPNIEDKNKYLKGDGTWATISADGYAIGDIAYRPYLRTGWVKANGATVNRSDYPTLVTFANEYSLWTENPSTEPWKFGVGDGSTTMVLPDYRNRFIQGSDGTSIIAAGLPNITGSLKFMSYGQSTSGAFTFSSDGSQSPSSGNWYSGVFNFNASRSSSIYGASTTVQPSAIALIAQIKY